ncbi:hypothetical protein, partial [Pseudomonas aeruginosa]|uniref:hypothetical protein n=1 Tax=Pseudomonas aeruginosa TaxID=287 RepID=UPI001C6543E6
RQFAEPEASYLQAHSKPFSSRTAQHYRIVPQVDFHPWGRAQNLVNIANAFLVPGNEQLGYVLQVSV